MYVTQVVYFMRVRYGIHVAYVMDVKYGMYVIMNVMFVIKSSQLVITAIHTLKQSMKERRSINALFAIIVLVPKIT